MAFLLRHIARYAVRKIASDPVAREQATRAARGVAPDRPAGLPRLGGLVELGQPFPGRAAVVGDAKVPV